MTGRDPSLAPGARLEFRILGPLEVVCGDARVAVRGEKQRTALAVLVLGANRVVPVDSLVEALWPDRPPTAATATVQSHVSHVRKALARSGIEEARASLVARGGGYVLCVEPAQIDAEQFERLVRTARGSVAAGDHTAAGSAYRSALELWRGPALADFLGQQFAQGPSAHLEELRLAAFEELFDCELALGHHAEIVSELEALTSDHPLRERLWAQRMTALFRSGRQTDALRAYQDLRNTLGAELGIDPTPPLQELERKILEHSPELEWAAPSPRPRSAGDLADSPPAVFMGRDEELSALSRWLDDAVEGSGHLVMVSGDAGIGKSALLRVFGARAERRGIAVHWGRCWEEEGAPAFWPWAEVIKSVVIRSGPDRGSPSLLEVSSTLSGSKQTEDAGREGGLVSGDARLRLFETTTDVFVEDESPSVILLEDVHEADEPSLQLLRFLTRRLGHAPVLVVATHRPVATRDAPLADFLANAAREPATRRIEMSALTDDIVSSLLRAAFPTEPRSAVVDAIRTRAEGNPFFVTELVRLVAGAPAAQPADLSEISRRGIPGGVREVVQRRLGGVGDDAVQVLAVGAVAGAAFSVGVVERVAAMGSDRVLDTLDRAVAARLIEEVRGSYGRYRFTHSLVRDTVYETLSGVRKARLHGAVAEAVERLPEPNYAAHLSELAHHYAVAAPELGADKALEYGTRAAEQARDQLAFEEAARLYGTLLDLLDAFAPDDSRRVELAFAHAHALLRAGDVDRARHRFSALAERARSAGDARMLAEAALGFGGAFEARVRDEALVRLLEDSLSMLEDEDAMRSRLLARLAMAQYFSAPGSRRDALSLAAVEAATRSEDPSVLAHAQNARYFALWDPDHPDQRREAAGEALRLSEQVGDRELELDALTWTVMDALESGAADDADRSMQRHAELADRLRNPRHRSYALTWRATRAFLDGRLDDAEALARQALALGERLSPLARTRFAGQLFFIRREQGRLAELQPEAEHIVANYPELRTGYSCMLAMIRVARRDRPSARKILEDVIAGWDRVHFDANWLTMAALAAELCAMVGDPDHAETLEAALAPYSDQCVVIRFGPACLGSAARYLGLLATRRRDWVAACEWFERALDANTRLRARTWVAHTQCEYAHALTERAHPGDRDRAGALRADAATAARRLGLEALLEERGDTETPATL